MNIWRDRDNRRYLLLLFLVCVMLAAAALLFCRVQTQRMQAQLVFHDQAVAGALLERNVPPETVAAALTGEGDAGQGRALLQQLGLSEKTPPWLLAPVRDFSAGLYRIALTGTLLAAAALWSLALLFLRRQARSLRDATQIVRQFSHGDFGTHLPRSDEGALSRLYAAVDQLATALQAQNTRAHQSKEFLKDTISDISHQLKTPLAALCMYNEIIAGEPGNIAAVDTFSGKSALALGRIEQLIDALLKITRLDAGSIVFEKAPHTALSLYRLATEELTTRAALEQKELTWQGDPEEPICCDLIWTAEALGNLIKNALDHTAAGGHIRVTWERSPLMLRLSVADDGGGVAPEDLHHIFKRFYRSAHASDRPGVGLGLPLAKTIFERQGGVLSVHSTPGEGTVFSVSFLTEP